MHPTDFFKFVKGPDMNFVSKAVDAALKPFTINPTMKTLHFVTAVLLRIEHFHALKLNFSAYDITRSLRDEVADERYDIVDLEKDYFNSKLLPVVEHSRVRAVVRELFAYDLVPNYKPEDNGQYINYKYSGTDKTVQQPASNFTLTPVGPNYTATPIGGPTNVVGSGPAVNALPASTLKAPDDEMWKKVDAYLAPRRGIAVSMKSIQSRLKGYDVTCGDIANYLQKSGRNLLRTTPYVSKALVY